MLVVGDSHLRPFADGLVAVPEGYSFGYMSTPGAGAAVLTTELLRAVLPRVPDAVCIMAPGNELGSRGSLDQSSADFVQLLVTARERCRQVSISVV